MKLSIVMPTFNQSKYIDQSIQSILNQTFQDFELIIVNDCSTDNTEKFIKKYENNCKITILNNQKNSGTGNSLNNGFSIAKGNYETWFASDNILYPSAFEELVNFLDNNQSIDYVYANCEIGIMDPTGLKELKRKNLKEEVNQTWNADKFFDNYNLGIVWMWRKELRINAGIYFQEGPCEDYEMTGRMIMSGGKFYFLDKCLGWFRRHQENMSTKLKDTGYPENLVKDMKKKYMSIKNQQQDFTKIYQQNVWGGRESRSGKGSDLEQTQRIINRIPHLIRKYDIKSIVDIGCGDLNWIKFVLAQFPDIKYKGLDVVLDLIERNKINFPKYEFECFDLLEKIYDFKADLVICRDVLVHHSNVNILAFLNKIAMSDCKYLLTTIFTDTHRRNEKDIDISRGISWRTINLTRSPFNLPEAMEIINERCTQIDVDRSTFKDKSLALWSIENIRKSFNIKKNSFFLNKNNPKIAEKVEKKTWNLEKIDRVINFYWGNNVLPYLRYLTVLTFRILNPDWKINFFFTKNNSSKQTWVSKEHKFSISKSKDYFDKLQFIKNIEFFEIDDNDYKDYPEVFKSDLLRWDLLSEKSGIWADMDIVFIKSMNECNFNTLENKDCDTGVQICQGYTETYHTIGFMFSGGNNNYFKYVRDIAKERINFDNYQSLGVCLLNDEFRTIESIKKKFKTLKVINIDKDLLYNFYPIKRVDELYKSNGTDYTNEKTIGIHWYGGYKLSGIFSNEIDHENIWNNNTLLAKKIRSVIK